MRLSVGHCGRISSSLSTCSWSSVKARTVVADQREVLTAAEALFRETAGERSYFVGIVLPGPGLPDAEIFLADSRPRPAHACVVHQQLRERVQRPGVRCHGAPPP